ncbi:MAG: hypothetical protein K2J30_05610, partial [Clostridia bacterium]|nr:hypothetical protein [Clostridia bacterium]
MSSGNIWYNTTSNTYSGAGVYVSSSGSFNMTNGYIRNNTASGATSGGGVYLAGAMKLTGGYIGYYNNQNYPNTATQSSGAGGVYYTANGSLSVGGGAAIANNKTVSSFTKDIVFASEKSKINVVSDITTGSYYRYGIYKTGVGAFTSGYGTYVTTVSNYTTNFTTQNSAYTLSTMKVNNVTEVSLTSINGTENWSQAVQMSLDAGGAQQTVKLTRAWNADSNHSFGTGTGYSQGRIYVPSGANVVLNLGGYSVDRGLTTATNYGSVFYVQGTLTIQGGNTSSLIKGGYTNSNTSAARGGGIHVDSGGIVNFKNGVIGSNRSNCTYGGGGVYVANGGTFNMSGGYIGYDTSTPNYAYGQNSGGGVYVASGGTFNMTGGHIRCNISSGATSAGGIYMSGIVKLSIGQIGSYISSSYPNKGNGATSAGGIYVASSGSLSFGGG